MRAPPPVKTWPAWPQGSAPAPTLGRISPATTSVRQPQLRCCSEDSSGSSARAIFSRLSRVGICALETALTAGTLRIDAGVVRCVDGRVTCCAIMQRGRTGTPGHMLTTLAPGRAKVHRLAIRNSYCYGINSSATRATVHALLSIVDRVTDRTIASRLPCAPARAGYVKCHVVVKKLS